jgi:ATP-dependent DNA ligase
MTELIPELASFPVYGTFDGELVAFDADGAPDLPLICERLLNRHHSIRPTYVIFDLLSLDARSLLGLPYSERRAELEALDLQGPYWHTPESFEDGVALFEAICERELESVVAKRRNGRYRPGERGWVKIKNRDYWRYEIERESASRLAGNASSSEARPPGYSSSTILSASPLDVFAMGSPSSGFRATFAP